MELGLRGEVEATQRERFRLLLIVGSGVGSAVFLLMPLLHLGTAIAAPLVLVAHMLSIRLYLIRQTRSLLGTTRRMFTRWIARFSFLWVGLPGYGMTAVPVLGLVFGLATFGGLTALVHFYTLWSLERERQLQPLMLWEKLVLVFLVVLTVGLLLVGLVGALVVGLSIAKLMELLTHG